MGNAKRDNTWPSVMWLAKRDFGDKYLWKCEISEVVINQLNLKKKKQIPESQVEMEETEVSGTRGSQGLEAPRSKLMCRRD